MNGTGIVMSDLQEGNIVLSQVANSTTGAPTTSAAHDHGSSTSAAVSAGVVRAEHSSASIYIGTALFMLVAFGIVSI